MAERLRQSLPVIIGLVLFLAALEVLRLELQSVSWQDLTADVLSTSSPRLAVAVVLTALNYLTLTGYDQLAFAYIGKSIPRRQIAAVSFVAYAVSNNVGFAMLSGASVRYRFYTRWGVTAEELSRIVFFYVTTFWLGLLLLGGVSLAVIGLPGDAYAGSPVLVRSAGVLLMLVAIFYVYVKAGAVLGSYTTVEGGAGRLIRLDLRLQARLGEADPGPARRAHAPLQPGRAAAAPARAVGRRHWRASGRARPTRPCTLAALRRRLRGA